MNIEDTAPIIPGFNHYDLARDFTQNQRWILTYRTQCCVARLEYTQTDYALFDDREVLFSLDLKNIGSFLDFRGNVSR